jgi:hypothetical protein
VIFRISTRTVIIFFHLKQQLSLAVSVPKSATPFAIKESIVLKIKEIFFSLVSSVNWHLMKLKT